MVNTSPVAGASSPATSQRQRRRETGIAVALVACVVLVGFWEIMANRSRRAFKPFELTAASFEDFQPDSPRWRVDRLPVSADPVEPNILALLVTPRLVEPGGGAPVLVRLVHGYNMVDCMRIKGDQVELIADTREAVGAAETVDGSRFSVVGAGGRKAEVGNQNPDTPTRRHADTSLPAGLQLWRLTSSSDRVGVWATTMLRAGGFSVTAVDTRSMPFPRVDIPDNPGWFPQGLTWRSLRHPIRNGRLFLRAKWNASRADLLTFLGLRQPAWASEELLTLVAESTNPTVRPENESAAAERVVAAQQFVLQSLQDKAQSAAP